MCQKRIALDKQILHCRSELSKICPAILVQSIRAKIRQLNSGLFDHLHQTKTLKLQQLIGPQITDDTTLHSHNTVITIPENLPLTDSEKSVLSKGLNFVPITKRTNEFTIKQDVEKFLRRVHLKAFFHDKEDDSDSAFRISVRWPIYIITSVDKTKFSYTTSPPTQHHSFFRNYPFIYKSHLRPSTDRASCYSTTSLNRQLSMRFHRRKV